MGFADQMTKTAAAPPRHETPMARPRAADDPPPHSPDVHEPKNADADHRRVVALRDEISRLTQQLARLGPPEPGGDPGRTARGANLERERLARGVEIEARLKAARKEADDLEHRLVGSWLAAYAAARAAIAPKAAAAYAAATAAREEAERPFRVAERLENDAQILRERQTELMVEELAMRRRAEALPR